MRTVLLTLTTCLLVLPAQAKYSGGTGEPNDPYQIATAADLIALGETPEDYDKHFILTNDIDLAGYVFDKAVIAPDIDPCDSDWSGFLFTGTTFTGVFDGKDRIVSHLTINGESYLGLFGSLRWPAEVNNLGVVDVNIAGSGRNIGGLAGIGGIVTSCYSTGDVTGVDFVGGLVGDGGGGGLTYCHSAAVVRGASSVGGLVGSGGGMAYCYSTGAVTGDSEVGGLMGYGGLTITQSYSTAVVRGTSSVGGLVGSICEGTVAQCYSTGAVSGTGDDVGGLVGSNVDGAVSDCCSTGTVTGNDGVGGLVGSNAGEMNVSSLNHCYSTGMVTGAGGNVGGLVGYNNEQAVVTASFWDIRTSGQVTSGAGTGKTTDEMQTASTFFLWGFCEGTGVWTIDDGHDYPRLSWEHEPGQPIQSSLSDFLKGDGTQDNPYLITTLADVNAIASFPCEQHKYFRLAFLSGTGTQEDPYLISTAEQLYLLGMVRYELNKHFLLTGDIDLDPRLPGGRVFDRAVIAPDTDPCDLWWGPIFTGEVFGGMFDGNGHVISHLTIKGASYLGLFGRLGDGAQVKNLGVVDVSVVGSGQYVGGLAGSTAWSATVTQCYSTGAVSGDRWVGGLVGSNGGTVTRCYSAVVARGQSVVGALVGDNNRTVSECYSTGGGELVGGGGATRSYSADGGLAGYICSRNGARIDLTATEMMNPYMFGLNGFANDPNWVLDAGRDYPRLAWEGKPGDIIQEPIIDWLEGQGTPDSSYQIDTADQMILLSRASILWDRHFVLGANIDLDPNLPGRQVFTQAAIQSFTGIFDGSAHTISHLTIDGKGGLRLGLFGSLGWAAEVRNLGVVDVNITGSGEYVGALAAYCGGHVANCYSTGVVSGTGYAVGGLVGVNGWGTLIHSYSSVSVSGTSHVAGLVGENRDGTVTQCYSAGAVSTTALYGSVGGLVGSNDEGIVTNSFWDTQASGQTRSSGGTGKTTAEMQDIQTFHSAGWDFAGDPKDGLHEIWQMPQAGGYPVLAIFNGYVPPQLQGAGTAENPYLISIAEEVGAMAYYSARPLSFDCLH